METTMILLSIFGGIIFILIVSGIRIVRPTQKALIERLGKYNRFGESGFNYIMPIFEKMYKVEITESMMEIDTQEIITEDNLNAKVDLVVFYKVKEDEQSIKKSIYKITDFQPQIIKLAQTTARNVIGTMRFKDVNSKRNELNKRLATILKTETSNWGVEIIRTELKEINPPAEVQNTMNQVIQAENTKRAAIDFATAKETEADGLKRAEIKKAEGVAQAKITIAEGQAKAIKLVNESANKYFKGNAQVLKKLEVTENSLRDNTKVVLTEKGDRKSVV